MLIPISFLACIWLIHRWLTIPKSSDLSRSYLSSSSCISCSQMFRIHPLVIQRAVYLKSGLIMSSVHWRYQTWQSKVGHFRTLIIIFIFTSLSIKLVFYDNKITILEIIIINVVIKPEFSKFPKKIKVWSLCSSRCKFS